MSYLFLLKAQICCFLFSLIISCHIYNCEILCNSKVLHPYLTHNFKKIVPSLSLSCLTKLEIICKQVDNIQMCKENGMWKAFCRLGKKFVFRLHHIIQRQSRGLTTFRRYPNFRDNSICESIFKSPSLHKHKILKQSANFHHQGQDDMGTIKM